MNTGVGSLLFSRDLPNPRSPALQADSLPAELPYVCLNIKLANSGHQVWGNRYLTIIWTYLAVIQRFSLGKCQGGEQ